MDFKTFVFVIVAQSTGGGEQVVTIAISYSWGRGGGLRQDTESSWALLFPLHVKFI